MSFNNLLDLYSLENCAVIFRHVHNEDLNSFAKHIENYRIETQNRYKNDEHLIEVLNSLRRVFFRFTGSFLPYSKVIGDELQQDLLHKFYQIKSSYPEFFSNVVVHIAKAYRQVTSSNTNSMSEFLNKYIKDNSETDMNIAIITKRAILPDEKTIIKSELRDTYRIKFYTDNGFRKEITTFDKVIYIGSPNYFGEYAKNTFKGLETIFLSYDMFKNSLEPKKAFGELDRSGTYSTIFNDVTIGKPIQRKVRIGLEERETLNIAVNKFLFEQENSGNSSQDTVEACLIYLENDRFLFAPRDSKIRTFTPDEKESFIKQVNFKDVEEDDFIIIRNERDTKLIAEVADQILKTKAESYRGLQNEWKERLRSMVHRNGLTHVSNLLSEKYFLKTASIASIRSWCDEDSICPTELPKLLKALKYDSKETEEIYSKMKEIRRAHLRAGRLISKKLMSELSADIVQDLKEQGFYNFTSEEFDGASFNIERIVSIDNARRLISPYNLMKPIHVN